MVSSDPTDRRNASFYLTGRYLGNSVIVLLVLALVFWAEVIYVIYVFGSYLQTSVALALFLFFLWHFCWLNLVISYLRTVFMDPGSVPVGFEADQFTRPCSSCSSLKPDRSHHCRSCGSCVLKMDHHCPWVNNCVGFRNQKFFILFLFYVSMTAFCYFLSALPIIVETGIQKMVEQPATLQVLVLMIVCFSFGLGLLGFAGIHFHLVLQNKTTLESYDDHERNPYDIGRRENWRQVFGPSPWYWFLPVYTTVGNGYEYPRNDRKELPDLQEVVEDTWDRENTGGEQTRFLSGYQQI